MVSLVAQKLGIGLKSGYINVWKKAKSQKLTTAKVKGFKKTFCAEKRFEENCKCDAKHKISKCGIFILNNHSDVFRNHICVGIMSD